MSKRSKEHNDRYVKLDDSMTNSAAWTAISFKAVWVYIELRKQFNFKAGGDSHLILPYSKVSWKMNGKTFSDAIKELVSYGFIRIVRHGGIPKIATVYALSTSWELKSRMIVDKEGREAIKCGFAKKPSFKNNLKNLQGNRVWERKKI